MTTRARVTHTPCGLTDETIAGLKTLLLRTAISDDGCWLWVGPVTPTGYGRTGHGQLAHRLMWAYANGQPIPDGLVVRHTCDVPLCCRPSHLLIGTQADNIQDMHDRGRAVTLRGEALPQTKLTERQVRAIRAAHAAGRTLNQLATDYSASKENIRCIVNRKRWTWVT